MTARSQCAHGPARPTHAAVPLLRPQPHLNHTSGYSFGAAARTRAARHSAVPSHAPADADAAVAPPPLVEAPPAAAPAAVSGIPRLAARCSAVSAAPRWLPAPAPAPVPSLPLHTKPAAAASSCRCLGRNSTHSPCSRTTCRVQGGSCPAAHAASTLAARGNRHGSTPGFAGSNMILDSYQD